MTRRRAAATPTRAPGRGPGIEGTSRPVRPAVACAGGPYDRMWWWLEDWTAQVATASRNARAWPGDTRRSPILDYKLTAKQVVNPIQGVKELEHLEHLVGQVAEYSPAAEAVDA